MPRSSKILQPSKGPKLSAAMTGAEYRDAVDRPKLSTAERKTARNRRKRGK